MFVDWMFESRKEYQSEIKIFSEEERDKKTWGSWKQTQSQGISKGWYNYVDCDVVTDLSAGTWHHKEELATSEIAVIS